MAIRIPHRFIDRLLPEQNTEKIEIIVIGTFNPGIPYKDLLTEFELNQFKEIESRPKFQKFNEVKNFYDRPQNRFWKIMDFIDNPDYYKEGISIKNFDGIKFYKKLDRQIVFEKQLTFCKTKNLLITDIVREIRPISFSNIYDNFPDTAIEQSECSFNTEGIISTIDRYKPKKVIVNFQPNEKTLPKIALQIIEIKKKCNDLFFIAPSTSGAAGNDYKTLIESWGKYFSNA